MSRRRSIWLVARREMLERGRSRAFFFSVLLSVGIIAGGLILPTLIGGSSTQHLGIVGATPAGFEEAIRQTAKSAGLTVDVAAVADQSAGEARLRDGSLDAVLVIPADGSVPSYVVKSRGNPLLQLPHVPWALRQLAPHQCEFLLQERDLRGEIVGLLLPPCGARVRVVAACHVPPPRGADSFCHNTNRFGRDPNPRDALSPA